VNPSYAVEVFYDGDCPLCMREISLLRRLDKKDSIRFTNLMAPDFDVSSTGTTWEALMDRIHGRLPDGTLIEGVEVFRRLYAAVGFRRAVALTRWPGISQLLDATYRVFAKNRLKLTGRCTADGCAIPQPMKLEGPTP